MTCIIPTGLDVHLNNKQDIRVRLSASRQIPGNVEDKGNQVSAG